MLSGITMTALWFFLTVFFLIVELCTVSLVSIWAAGGSFVAFILALLHVPIPIQLLAFLAVTAVLLYLTKKYGRKILKQRRIRTNVDEMIGKKILISERVDNIQATGTAKVAGKDWTVRTEEGAEPIEAGEMAEVLKVSGVKLIVRKAEKEETGDLS